MTPREAHGILAAEKVGLRLNPKQRHEAHQLYDAGQVPTDLPPPTLDWRQIIMRCVEEGECLLWNQGCLSTGYPQARIDGRSQMVARYVYTELLGKTVKQGCCLTTRCRNKRCLAPACLLQITRGEMLKRSYDEGTRSGPTAYQRRVQRYIKQGKAKLSFEIAETIRRERMSESNEVIAQELGVHPKTIYSIKRGLNWRSAAPASSVFALAAAV